ncbi:MAG: right-handed parallel beta-helix repeat-containing protein [bacterium]|nr:right-handed parallel beta-helix repeat-containing protein [bacterium]
MKFSRFCTVFACLLTACFINIPTRADEMSITTCDFATLKSIVSQQKSDLVVNFACDDTIIFTEQLLITYPLSINGNGNTIFDGNQQTDFFSIEEDIAVYIDGVQFQNGNRAIVNRGNLTITNSQFRHNHHTLDNHGYFESNYAGVIFNAGGSVVIQNSTFYDNRANIGGAIYNAGEMTITDSQFSYNRAELQGGAILNKYRMTITNTKFYHNKTNGDYGGAVDSIGYVNISESYFYHNIANSVGGAIHIRGELNAIQNHFSFNHAMTGGAIGMRNESIVHIEENIFSDNVASLGGAIMAYNAIATIRHNVLIRNHAYRRGVIYDDSNISALIEENTFVANTTQDIAQADSSSTTIVQNNVFATDITEIDTTEISHIIAEPQSITLTTCTFEALSQAIMTLNERGGEMTVDCGADDIIPITSPLFIEADVTIRGANLDALGETHVLVVRFGASLTLEDVTVKNGYSNLPYFAGAITNDGEVIIKNSYFEGNHAHFGGAFINRGIATIENSVFVDNHASLYGGAIANYNLLNITDTAFQMNSSQEHGGAIYQGKWAEGAIYTSQFTSNTALDGDGGAIYYNFNPTYNIVANGRPDTMLVMKTSYQSLLPSQVRQNTQDSNDLMGIGNYWDNSITAIHDSLFEDNSALNGGAIHGSNTWISIINCQFNRNHATYKGGASIGALDIDNSTFFENSADQGGALYQSIVLNSTFFRNHATSAGGAIYQYQSSKSTFVENTAPVAGAIYQSMVYSNLISGEYPQCAELYASFGSMSPSITDTFCHEDYILVDDLRLGEFDGRIVPLLADSPAIDADPCEASAFDFDQLGTPRPQGNACDFGAVEFVPQGDE